MPSTVAAPLEWVESIGDLRLTPRADARLQDLMDRNNNSKLSTTEYQELETFVEMSEILSLVRAEALRLLGRKPQ